MYEFISTHDSKTLSDLTTAYEQLQAATSNAQRRSGAARQAESELHGALHAKQQNDGVIAKRRRVAHSAQLQEQAARKPLLTAIMRMAQTLDTTVYVTHRAQYLEPWQHDALKVNCVCAAKLISVAIQAYNRLGSYPTLDAHTRSAMDAAFQASLDFSKDLPPMSLEPTNRQEFRRLDFLLRAVGIVLEEPEAQSCISVEDPLDNSVLWSEQSLKQAGWKYGMQDEQELGEGFTPGFEVDAPARFRKAVRTLKSDA